MASAVNRRPVSRGSDNGQRVIRYRSSLHNTIEDVLRGRGWVECEGEMDWDFFWADVGWIHEELDKQHLLEHQRLNHFRNHYELTRKDHMVKNLKRMKKQLEREGRQAEADKYDFFPVTFCLPQDYGPFVEEFKRLGGTWIMKPVGKAQGKGIFLMNKLSQISDWRRNFKTNDKNAADQTVAESYVVQRYIDNPYLVGGKKFDMRLYMLVVSYMPLKCYLFRGGFARFTNTRFSMDKEDMVNTFIHLTNVAIQKTAPDYEKGTTTMKLDVHDLKMYLTSKHGAEAVNRCFSDVHQLMMRALLAVQPTIIQDRHCFELYGYDILLDHNLKPWLLEINASPSLTADTQADYDLKYAMLDDMLNIVDMEGRFGGTIPVQVGGFDLVWDQGPVAAYEDKTSLPTLLGTYIDREDCYKKLFSKRSGNPTA
eukprot:jgi/Mesvir1/13180/Mv06143-RA.1